MGPIFVIFAYVLLLVVPPLLVANGGAGGDLSLSLWPSRLVLP
jgi:hypothetical protein